MNVEKVITTATTEATKAGRRFFIAFSNSLLVSTMSL